MIGTQWAGRHPRGLIVALGLLAFGLTGCYTQLKVTESEPPSPQAEQLAETERYAGAVERGYDPCANNFFHDPWSYNAWCQSALYGPLFQSYYGGPFSLRGYYFNRPWRFGFSYLYGHHGGGFGRFMTGLLTSAVVDGPAVDGDDDRARRPRRGTIGRGSTSGGSRTISNRSRTTESRTDRSNLAEEREGRVSGARGPRMGRSTGDRREENRSGRSPENGNDPDRSPNRSDSQDQSDGTDRNGEATRPPEMSGVPVLTPGVDDETNALAEIDHTTLERAQISPPPMEGRDRLETLRTYRALQRIVEMSNGRAVSIRHREAMSATLRHLARTENATRSEITDGDRFRVPGLGRGPSETDRTRSSRTSARPSSGRSAESDRSTSIRSSSNRGDGDDSGRDRSRSDDSGSR